MRCRSGETVPIQAGMRGRPCRGRPAREVRAGRCVRRGLQTTTCLTRRATAGRVPAGSPGSASGSPDTGNSAAAGWGSRHSGHPSAGARAAHRPRSRAWGPGRAARWPGAGSPPPPRRRAVAGSRSPGGSSSHGASGSGSERTWVFRATSIEAGLEKSRRTIGPADCCFKRCPGLERP